MKKTLFLCLIALVLVIGCVQQQQATSIKPEQQQQPANPPGQAGKTGILRVSLTDQPAQGYEKIWVSVSSVEVHREGVWETVFEGIKTFDLLKLNGVKELIGEKELPAGKYTQARLGVSKVELVESGQAKPVKVPGEKIKLVNNFDVAENQTSEIVIDFDPYSVVVEAQQLILKPVIRVLSVQEFNERVEKTKRQKRETQGEKEKPKILQLSFPTTANPDQTITISWQVSGGIAGKIEHTAVHWDTVGGHGENFNEYPNRSEIQTGKTPQDFSVQIKLPSAAGTRVFFRTHAIVDGIHVYSPELEIVLAPAQPVQAVEEFTVKVNDARFEPASIEVKKGSLVKITLAVDTSNVSFGGEDIRSSEFNTGTIAPGQSKQVQFTAKNSFKVSAYWPSSNNWKADMQVIVK